MRALPVLAAALLVCSAVVGVAGGLPQPAVSPSPAVPTDATTPTDAASDASDPAALTPTAGVAQTDGNGTESTQQIRVLDVPVRLVSRSTVRTHYVDLGPSITLASDETTERLQTLAAVERVEAANSTDERRARLRAEFRDLEASVEGLDQRQEAAIADYAARRISPRDFLVRMVEISLMAEALDDRRIRLEGLAADTPEFDPDRGQLASIRHRIDTFGGPVRAHARLVLEGETAPSRFYVVTGPKSVAISTIDGDTYYREAYRGDLKNGDGERIELEVALDVVSSSYPVIWDGAREQTQVFGGGDSYPVRVAHARGDLTAFVDSTASTVYAEHQRRPLDTVVTDAQFQTAADGLTLVVNHTYPGGPMQVRVLDADTGTPVDATVTVDGTAEGPVGATGEDGTLWTLSPGGQFTVTATRNGDSVSTPVRAGESPRVHAPTAPPQSGNQTDTGNATATPTSTTTTASQTTAPLGTVA